MKISVLFYCLLMIVIGAIITLSSMFVFRNRFDLAAFVIAAGNHVLGAFYMGYKNAQKQEKEIEKRRFYRNEGHDN